jgi:hypothetical protein
MLHSGHAMNLYSPQRPTLPNGRPCWLNGSVAIYVPDVWPEADGSFTLRLMLPLATGDFVARQYHTRCADTRELALFFADFTFDPEEICERIWPNEAFELRRPITDRRNYSDSPTTPRRQRSAAPAVELEITF